MDEPTRDMVERAQAGERQVLEALFARLYPDLLQAVRVRLGPVLRARLDSLDVAQSVWLAAHRDLGRFEDRGEGSFRRWLLAVVENVVRAQAAFHGAKKRDLRLQVPFESGACPSPAVTPSRQIIEDEARERLERALDLLPDDHREVIIQRHYLDMSWREVGEAMGRSQEAAKMLFQRAIQGLRETYRKEDRP